MTKSGKHCGKKRNCLFSKKPSAAEVSEKNVYMRERVIVVKSESKGVNNSGNNLSRLGTWCGVSIETDSLVSG